MKQFKQNKIGPKFEPLKVRNPSKQTQGSRKISTNSQLLIKYSLLLQCEGFNQISVFCISK